jgi:hypothetical protein
MPHHADVIDVHIRIAGLRHQDRIIPEAKVVDAIGALGYSQKRFSIRPFYSRQHQDLALVFNCSGIECGIDSHPLHQVWIRLGIEVIPPENGRVLRGDHWVLIPIEDAVPILQLGVFPPDQLFVVLE